jgi:hypothetical protein
MNIVPSEMQLSEQWKMIQLVSASPRFASPLVAAHTASRRQLVSRGLMDST